MTQTVDVNTVVRDSGEHDRKSQQFARTLDSKDEIASYRSQFLIPSYADIHVKKPDSIEDKQRNECVYLCGNSLGLQPKNVPKIMDVELEKWAKKAVIGHHDDSERPWVSYEDHLNAGMAPLLGAKEVEVAVMNGLTVNLHLMLVAFYRPTTDRYKIIMEDHAFPSDHYAVESQVRLQGQDPANAIVYIKPRDGEETLRTEDIVATIREHGESLATVMLSAVQYYTGQFFDMPTITSAGKAVGAKVGWDLAHAVGNVPLSLHEWNVDFACFCSYKYLNAGPGGIAGVFVHETYADATEQELPRMTGWWAHKLSTRFEMSNVMELNRGAAGFQLSNVPIYSSVGLTASLQIFNEVGMSKIRTKSMLLTAYLEMLLEECIGEEHYDIITPQDPEQRGSQLSIVFKTDVKAAHKAISDRGIVCDFRAPSVIRIAPVALYNSFEDVWYFVNELQHALEL
eukprot:Clim_evm47s108 gene=Clim_evmTU47s108